MYNPVLVQRDCGRQAKNTNAQQTTMEILKIKLRPPLPRHLAVTNDTIATVTDGDHGAMSHNAQNRLLYVGHARTHMLIRPKLPPGTTTDAIVQMRPWGSWVDCGSESLPTLSTPQRTMATDYNIYV